MHEKPLVGIVMGSDTDLPVMAEAAGTLKKFQIPFEIEIARRPSVARCAYLWYARTAVQRGLESNHCRRRRCGAPGRSDCVGNHPAGGWSSHGSPPRSGLDALLSTVQMPGGVPVACTAIGKPGAINAAIFAAQIIATSDAATAQKLFEHKKTSIGPHRGREIGKAQARVQGIVTHWRVHRRKGGAPKGPVLAEGGWRWCRDGTACHCTPFVLTAVTVP